MISGTNGIFGASDGAWILSRESRQAREAILSVTGRDQPDAVLSLIQDPKTCLWEIDHEDSLQDQPIIDPVVQALCSFSGWLPSWSGTATELKEMLHLDEIPVNTITKRLNAICKIIGIEPRPLHKARKTYATRLINANVDDSLVQSQMRHADISTTRRLYYFDNRSAGEKSQAIERAIGQY